MTIRLFTADTIEPGDYIRTLTVDNLPRSYLIHVPKKYDPKTPTPVVLAFHGGWANAEHMVMFSGLNTKSDEVGFIVIYPNGTARLGKLLTFNGGNCCGYAMTNQIDDVEFTRQLLDDLNQFVNIDPKRIFATGMSNGGFMAYRLASELSDRIAAIAPVAAPMGTETCNPKRPVSVIHFHGTADEFSPFYGGKGKGQPNTAFYSVAHSIQAWVKMNGCKQKPVVTLLPNQVKDGTTITRKTYRGGKYGAEVVLVVVEGGGHTWPGQEPHLQALGKSTKNISANDLMWEFFEKHAMWMPKGT